MYSSYKPYFPYRSVADENDILNKEAIIEKIELLLKYNNTFASKDRWELATDDNARIKPLNRYKKDVFSIYQGTARPDVHEHSAQMIEWINTRIESLQTDNRIKGKLSQDKVEEYFMQLNNFKYEKKKIELLSKEEIQHLLRANFFGFEPKQEIKKFNLPEIINRQHFDPFAHVF
ncbi:MAG TPA: hypothetical protein VF411_07985, partial [Bacteroidia bacterium]